MTISIGILVFDEVEELDFVGPWEVFTMANEVAQQQGKTHIGPSDVREHDACTIAAPRRLSHDRPARVPP